MTEVSLAEILAARERRAAQQRAILAEHPCTLICFTMNIAGPVKTSPLIERAFSAGLDALRAGLAGMRVIEERIARIPTGCEAYLSVDADAQKVKQICIAVEEACPLGRLFDMDVLTAQGGKLDRPTQRGCLVCGLPGRSCAASRAHPVHEIQRATRLILENHFARADREHIAQRAVQCLLDEVSVTPKPGLVDLRNTGSHTDMDVAAFHASADSLLPYFRQCIRLGQETAQCPPAITFSLLRHAGMDAERDMFAATGGVNTHKGAVFSLGVICGAIGRLWSAETPVADECALLGECARLVADAVQADFTAAQGDTAGMRLYRKSGMTGVRGEAAAGFPSVSGVGLPAYRSCLRSGLSRNDAAAVTLLHLIANVKDTALYHRGGEPGALFAAREAAELIAGNRIPSATEIKRLDDAFIERNLSPGGCADLLAVTLFLFGLRETAPAAHSLKEESL